MSFNDHTACADCGAKSSHRYRRFRFGEIGESCDHEDRELCVRCARAERRLITKFNSGNEDSAGVSREELIAELDRYFEESGAAEICNLCHRQGTGCCPVSCRTLSDQGCTRKNLWCSAFVCSALMNALAQCDPESARTLRWARREIGPAEFRVYEMMTRVPAKFRETERPLTMPARYPGPLALGSGIAIRDSLMAMSKDVLEIRRIWHEEELRQSED